MWRQAIALLVMCALFTGCYTTRRFPAVPVPVRLSSPQAFLLVQPETATSPLERCAVISAELEFVALRGDTLYFSQAKVLRQPQGVASCAPIGAGFVALADHPELRALRPTSNGALTWAAILGIALPAALVGIILISCLIGCDIG